MNETLDISIYSLALGFLLMVLPIIGFIYFKVRIIKETLISILRMIIQLSLIAVYLEYIFEWNNAWINASWVIAMVMVGAYTTVKRVGLNYKYFLLPFFIAGFTSIVILDAFFLGWIIRLDYVFDARYFIPITGMVLGNALNHNIVGVSNYFDRLDKEQDLYYFLLINGSSRKKALEPFISSSIRKGLNPLIATMSVIGLISLPGMMTGQILGGSSPVVAIKYQILIMLAVFVGSTLNLMICILLANRHIFDSFGSIKPNILKKTR
ncbi:ABC transporter permease [Marinifilum caeruleilacunae]|uniref:ABC transporter permease n=1 Tax=Marinifilum caeruleilacunae TaxID=2499076 RepID=A0ABX1WRQ7_9BACT|nr:ABC transporter permease [Marinifilum caeruleilacunae]NOU58687.1 ABC transporter permease [Marinifilum caeruleilacunae]